MTGHPGTCAMPDCPSPATTRNRADQSTCGLHERVVVSGSWMDDKHGSESHG